MYRVQLTRNYKLCNFIDKTMKLIVLHFAYIAKIPYLMCMSVLKVGSFYSAFLEGWGLHGVVVVLTVHHVVDIKRSVEYPFMSGCSSERNTGGGGGTSIMYAYWVCAARETPIFSPEFPFRSISFSQITPPKKKNPFRSITILHFLSGFSRSGDHHFQNVFNFNPFIAFHGRLSPNFAFGSAAAAG